MEYDMSQLIHAFNQLQKEMLVWQTKNFPSSGEHVPLLGALEELGELAHAHIKGEQKIRHTPEEIRAKKIDALADVIIYLVDYANRCDISLGYALQETWQKVQQRDWTVNPMDADKKVI